MTFRKGDPKPAGSGRGKGTANKYTEEVRKLAGKHGAAAIARLADLMENAQDERAQVAAAKEIIERAYGKSAMPITGEGGQGPVQVKIIGDDAKL